MEFLNSILSNEGAISSARLINIGGFITSTGLMVMDFHEKNGLDTANFIAYLTYCAGGFAVSKGLDYLQNKGVSNANTST